MSRSLRSYWPRTNLSVIDILSWIYYPNFVRQQGIIEIVVLIILALAIAGGAYYLGRQSNLKPTSSPTVKVSPTPTLTDETRSWKTYENNNLKFSFRYPGEYNFEVHDPFPDKRVQVLLNPEEDKFVDINANKEVEHRTPADIYLDNRSIGTVKIGEYEWYVFYLSSGYSDGPVVATSPIYAYQREDENGILYSVGFNGDREQTRLHSEILSTFKFTSQRTR